MDGYETEIDGYDVTNTHVPEETEPEKTRVSVKKVWDDDEDRDGIRPESITVTLYANGKKADVKDAEARAERGGPAHNQRPG